METVAILICAHNEEAYIGRTIDLIHRTGLNFNHNLDLIVVNDGSTDKTSKIARERGARVVDLPKNVGKANAFFAGIKEALKREPVALVTVDADMIRVPRRGLSNLIIKAKKATGKGRTKMIVSGVYESSMMQKAHVPQVGYLGSGIRSFSTPALHFLTHSKAKKFAKGYGLESFLDILLKERRVSIRNFGFIAEQAARTAKSKKQVEDLWQTRKKERQIRKYSRTGPLAASQPKRSTRHIK